MMIEGSIALYLRISDEDKEKKNESESITGQRILLENYVRNHSELYKYPLLQFVDDGYSGTNFDRPGIQSLLTLIKEKKVSCIVVKDFSRFGRNYIEVGNYVEQVFPFLGARFISVNDNFDSINNFGTSTALDFGFKNLIHDLYSKDLSTKVTSVRRMKSKAGKFVTAFAPYGYIKSKKDKNTLVADEECALVVKRIFEMALDGKTKADIARTFNAEGVLSPIMVRKARKENFRSWCANENCYWTLGTIAHILDDRRYTGDLIYGKLKPTGVGSGKDMRAPEDEWIIVPDAHAAIISHEEFDAVQAMKRKHNYKRLESKHPLAGKIRCDVCNHSLTKRLLGKPKHTMFFCRTSGVTEKYKCFSGKLKESDIETTILSMLNHFVSLIDEIEDIEKILVLDCGNAMKSLARLEQQLSGLKQSRLSNYESYKNEQISKGIFIGRKTEFERKIDNVQNEMKQIEKQIEERSKAERSEQPNIKDLKGYAPFEALSNDIVEKFIEDMWIDVMGKLHIKWSFVAPF